MTETEIMNCPKCNGQINAKSVFCRHCKSLLKNDSSNINTTSVSTSHDEIEPENLTTKFKNTASDIANRARKEIDTINYSELVDKTSKMASDYSKKASLEIEKLKESELGEKAKNTASDFTKKAQQEYESIKEESSKLEEMDRIYGPMVYYSALLSIFIPFANVLAPVAVWSAAKDKSDYIYNHGKMSVNVNIFYTLIFMVAILLARFGAFPIFLIYIGILAYLALLCYWSINAYRGKEFKPFPLIIKVVK